MSSSVRTFLLLFVGLAAWGPSAASSQQGSRYSLRPGDKVTVEVFTSAGVKVDVVAGERILDRNGDIYLPFVGTVHVEALDETSLRDVLVGGYGGYYADPVVNVRVQLRVNVTGAVARPGQYYMDPTATLLDALIQAGGSTTEFAVAGSQIPGDSRHVQLVREGERIVLNLHPADITEETMRLLVRSGDWLNVPPEHKTAVRDQILFWGNLVTLTTSVIGLVILIGRGAG